MTFDYDLLEENLTDVQEPSRRSSSNLRSSKLDRSKGGGKTESGGKTDKKKHVFDGSVKRNPKTNPESGPTI